MNTQKRPAIYVAGAYSADNVLTVLDNMRTGIRVCIEIIKAGGAPFCPWIDFQYGLSSSLSLEDYQETSIAWLLKADAAYFLNRWADSRGAAVENRIARANKIPCFYQSVMSPTETVTRILNKRKE